jgi:hypothetical protein
MAALPVLDVCARLDPSLERLSLAEAETRLKWLPLLFWPFVTVFLVSYAVLTT